MFTVSHLETITAESNEHILVLPEGPTNGVTNPFCNS